jgi:DNA-binding HxlR family transcriptional regulator
MTKLPIPGKPVRGSQSGAPIMALFDLLGRRWAMGILWTLCKDGPCTFRELQERCGSISPTVLNTRLKELRQAGLIEHLGEGYRATPKGTELYGLLVPLGAWSKEWARMIGPVSDD